MSALLKDPEMKEAVDEFINESRELIEELEELCEKYEDQAENKLLEKYGQVIDRMMGAAKSLEAHKTGTLCELGKIIGYKASQVNDSTLQGIVINFLFDTNEVLTQLIDSIEKNQEEKIEKFNVDDFLKRMMWLKDKFAHIDRASVAIDTKKSDTIISKEQLLKIFGN